MTETARPHALPGGAAGSLLPVGGIRAIVFDLDGTLYVSEEYAATIREGAAAYLADELSLSVPQARLLLAETRLRLTRETGAPPTLSALCASLGGSIAGLHASFQRRLSPESYLARDERVVGLLRRLGRRFSLYLYTNNNLPISTRITRILGIGECFAGLFSIEGSWRAKPDGETLDRLLMEVGLPPAQVLFVGDRYDVDLSLPQRRGCPVYLSQSIDQLLDLERVLGDDAP